MKKFRVLVEVITASPFPNNENKSFGTSVAFQLIECETREEADEVWMCVPKVGVSNNYMRNAYKLYT